MTVRQVYLKVLRATFALVMVATTALAAEAATASWDRNTEANIAGYKLSYGTQPGVHTRTIDVGNVTTCQFNPGPGVYYVVVQAYDTAGELSVKSAEVAINIAGTVSIDSLAPAGSNSIGSIVPTPAAGTKASGGAVATVTYTIPFSNSGASSVTYPSTPPSADGTLVPPASQVTDATGGVWTIDGAQRILRNGVQAGGGAGSKILWMSGSVYVLGSDGQKWWRWSDGWTNAGTILPSNSGALSGASVTAAVPVPNSAEPAFSAESLKTAAVPPASSAPAANANLRSLENSDLPVLGDFDGDGRADLATYRPSLGEWRIWTALSGFSAPTMAVWGMAGDLPLPADYDGDRATDISFYRPSTGSWHVWLSRTQKHLVVQWGDPDDRPVALDQDGDGKADLALIRDGAYEILLSRTNYLTSVTVR